MINIDYDKFRKAVYPLVIIKFEDITEVEKDNIKVRDINKPNILSIHIKVSKDEERRLYPYIGIDFQSILEYYTKNINPEDDTLDAIFFDDKNMFIIDEKCRKTDSSIFIYKVNNYTLDDLLFELKL